MITIITIFDENEEFIELQYKSVKKFVKGDYEFIVFNCANHPHQFEKNEKICKDLNINYINIKMGDINGDTSLVGGVAFNRCFEHLKDKIVFKLDSDMFFINEINISDFFDKDLIMSPRIHEGKEIAWGGIFGLNLKNIKDNIDFRPGIIPNTDAFGHSIILTQNPNYTKKRIEHICIEDFDDKKITAQINASGDFSFSNFLEFSSSEKLIEKYKLISSDTESPYNKLPDGILKIYEKILKHKKIYSDFNPPKPIHIDILSYGDNDFIVHFRSANGGKYNINYLLTKKDVFYKYLTEYYYGA